MLQKVRPSAGPKGVITDGLSRRIKTFAAHVPLQMLSRSCPDVVRVLEQSCMQDISPGLQAMMSTCTSMAVLACRTSAKA